MSALPAVRLLRGDAGFGYELGGMGPDKGRSVEAMAQELVSGVMVRTLLGLPNALSPVDSADATAVALCHLARVPGRRARAAVTAAQKASAS